MYEWIRQLGPGQWLLDLGAGGGSFLASEARCSVAAVDEHPNAFCGAAPSASGPYFRVFAKGQRIPFKDAAFDLVLCHNALEHMTGPEEALKEIGRVLKPGGQIFISVPNGYGLCDAIYRFVFAGGGHVNRFERTQVVGLIEKSTGSRLVRWHKLYSSFVYLSKLIDLLKESPPGGPQRLATIGRVFPPRVILAAQKAIYTNTRRLDRLFHTDLAVYGWALYFERPSFPPPAEQAAFVNVCLFCGSGHPAANLDRPSWRCSCGGVNPFIAPFGNTI